jgi:hypothetical protein
MRAKGITRPRFQEIGLMHPIQIWAGQRYHKGANSGNMLDASDTRYHKGAISRNMLDASDTDMGGPTVSQGREFKKLA